MSQTVKGKGSNSSARKIVALGWPEDRRHELPGHETTFAGPGILNLIRAFDAIRQADFIMLYPAGNIFSILESDRAEEFFSAVHALFELGTTSPLFHSHPLATQVLGAHHDLRERARLDQAAHVLRMKIGMTASIALSKSACYAKALHYLWLWLMISPCQRVANRTVVFMVPRRPEDCEPQTLDRFSEFLGFDMRTSVHDPGSAHGIAQDAEARQQEYEAYRGQLLTHVVEEYLALHGQLDAPFMIPVPPELRRFDFAKHGNRTWNSFFATSCAKHQVFTARPAEVYGSERATDLSSGADPHLTVSGQPRLDIDGRISVCDALTTSLHFRTCALALRFGARTPRRVLNTTLFLVPHIVDPSDMLRDLTHILFDRGVTQTESLTALSLLEKRDESGSHEIAVVGTSKTKEAMPVDSPPTDASFARGDRPRASPYDSQVPDVWPKEMQITLNLNAPITDLSLPQHDQLPGNKRESGLIIRIGSQRVRMTRILFCRLLAFWLAARLQPDEGIDIADPTLGGRRVHGLFEPRVKGNTEMPGGRMSRAKRSNYAQPASVMNAYFAEVMKSIAGVQVRRVITRRSPGAYVLDADLLRFIKVTNYVDCKSKDPLILKLARIASEDLVPKS